MQRKLLLFLLVLLTSAGTAWADTVTETAFEQYFNGNSSVPGDYGFALSYGAGSNANLVKYSVTGGGLQCVAGPYASGNDGARTGAATATFNPISNSDEVTLSYTWALGNATGNATGSWTRTYIGNESGKAIDIQFSGSDNNGTLYLNGVAIKSGNSSIRNTTYTVSAVLNLNTKKITSLTLTCSNSNFSYTISSNLDFADDINTIDRFVFENSERQNWENTSSVDDISITYKREVAEVYFTSSTCRAELTALNIEEPTLIYPEGAVVTYSLSNNNIASLGGENHTGDLMAVNTGTVTVTATVLYQGFTYTASYDLIISADEATYEVNDNTYTLTGPGKLGERVVTSVPKITMEFGENDDNITNTTIVRDEGGIGVVATTLDVNGWRQLWYDGSEGTVKPYQGTFYTFKPKASGELNVKGYLSGGNSVYLVDAENLAHVPSNMTAQVYPDGNYWNGSTPPGEPTPRVNGYKMAEKYETTVATTGDILSQTVTGLPDGRYTVVLQANACFTSGRNITDANGNVYVWNGDIANNIANVFVESGGVRQSKVVTAQDAGSVSSNGRFSFEVDVTNGTLTMGMNKTQQGTNWHTIQIESLNYLDAVDSHFKPVAEFVPGSDFVNNQEVDIQASLEGGKTYYLYANIPSSNNVDAWGTYQLQQFSYESNFRYEDKSIVLDRDVTEGGQPVIKDDFITPEFRMELKGDITSAELDPATGYVSNIQGDGGAIVVFAKNGIDEIYYVITVPYKEKVWDFKANANDEEKQGLEKDLEWAVNYEVRTYDSDTRNLVYLNNPILTANEALEGNNAAYIGETAGLVVNAAAKTFGLMAEADNYGDFNTFKAFFLDNPENRVKYANYIETYSLDELTEQEFENLKEDGAFVDVYLKLMLNFNKAQIAENSTTIGAMQRGAVLTLPKMKAGEYVAIKWYRHGGDQGDNIKVTNLTDLSGLLVTPEGVEGTPIPITQNFLVINQNNLKGEIQQAYDSPYGWLEFQVQNDGDVTFEVDDKGWTHIKQIAISPEFIDTDLRLVVGQEAAPITYTHRGEGVEIRFNDTDQSPYQPQRQEAFFKVEFSLEEISSTLKEVSIVDQIERDPEGPEIPNRVYKDAILKAKGHGTLVVVQKAVTDADHGSYVIDIEKTKITIIEGGDTHQEYPYTWDFTNISDETKGKLARDNNWTTTDDGNTYSPNNGGQQKYVQNTEIEIGDEDDEDDVKEYDGLGFLTSTDNYGYSTGMGNIGVTTDGTGLKIGGGETTTIVVPDVPEGCTVYVRLEPNNENSVVNSNGEPLDPTQTKVNGTNENLYEVPVEKDPESDGTNQTDVLLELKDVTVKGIAVTNILKECQFWDETVEHDNGAKGSGYYCYNSDSHDKPIKYSLTEYYTNVFMNAQIVKSTDSETNTVELEDIDYTPAYTGVIVYSIDKGVDHPLFVPAVNDQKTASDDERIKAVSMMTPHVEKGEVDPTDDTTVRYVFTNVYNKVSDKDTKITANTPGFYQVNEEGTLKANRAYLELPKQTSAGVKASKFYLLRPISDSEDMPTEISTIENSIDLDGVFYTISGVRIQGRPSQKGIYIQNGKKVMLK